MENSVNGITESQIERELEGLSQNTLDNDDLMVRDECMIEEEENNMIQELQQKEEEW